MWGSGEPLKIGFLGVPLRPPTEGQVGGEKYGSGITFTDYRRSRNTPQTIGNNYQIIGKHLVQPAETRDPHMIGNINYQNI